MTQGCAVTKNANFNPFKLNNLWSGPRVVSSQCLLSSNPHNICNICNQQNVCMCIGVHECREVMTYWWLNPISGVNKLLANSYRYLLINTHPHKLIEHCEITSSVKAIWAHLWFKAQIKLKILVEPPLCNQQNVCALEDMILSTSLANGEKSRHLIMVKRQISGVQKITGKWVTNICTVTVTNNSWRDLRWTSIIFTIGNWVMHFSLAMLSSQLQA